MNIIAMKISSAAKIIALGIASALLLSCAPDWGYDTKFGNMPSDRPGHGDRVPSPETRKVLLLYSAGFNSISGYLNINFCRTTGAVKMSSSFIRTAPYPQAIIQRRPHRCS